MKLSRVYSVIACLVAFVLLLGACTTVAPGVELPVSSVGADLEDVPVTLYMVWGEPGTLDPSLVISAPDFSLMGSLFMTLTEIDLETQEALPFLAERWESNEDRTEWTFYLRQDIPWVSYNLDTGTVDLEVDENGAPRMVNAYDVVYGTKRLLDPTTASPFAYILYNLRGAFEANTSDPSSADSVDKMAAIGVEALDDWTVRFTLNNTASYWPQLVASAAIAQPAWAIEAAGDSWTEPEAIVTNNAYTLQRWLHDDSIDMIRNPHWPLWGNDFARGNLDQISLVFVDAVAAISMYEQGELDTTLLPILEIERVKSEPLLNQELVEASLNCNGYMIFQTQKPPTDIPAVRRALSMAIDRQTFISDILHMSDVPANTMTPPGNFGSSALDVEIAPWALTEEQGGTGYERALELGRQELADAGYPNGAGLSITFLTTSDGSIIGQVFQSMWQTAYPEIDIVLELLEPQAAAQAVQPDASLAETPNIRFGGWCADYPHAHNFLYERFHSVAGENGPRLSVDDPLAGKLIEQFDALTNKAQTSPDDETPTLYKAAEKLLVEDIAAIAPVSYSVDMFLTKPWLNRVYHETRLHLYQWTLDVDARSASK